MKQSITFLLCIFLAATLHAQNIGIGTSTPTQKLEVNGNVKAGSALMGTHPNYSGATFWKEGSRFALSSDGTNTFVGSDAGFISFVANNASRMIIESSGNVGINQLSPTTTLDVGGSGKFSGNISAATISVGQLTATGDVLCNGYFKSYFSAVGGYLLLDRNASNQAIWVSSDKRLKKNITTIHSALLKLEKLNAITFNWNQTGYNHLIRNVQKQWTSLSGTKEDNEKLWSKVKRDEFKKLTIKQYGFLAQDVEKIFPDWVKEEDGYKQINMEQLMPVVVEAIKELRDQKDAEINTLKKEVVQLENKLQTQNAMLAKRLQQLELLVQSQTPKSDVVKK